MSDATLWVKLRDEPRLSWHIVANGRTRCGRLYAIPSPTVEDQPLNEKSCERCATLTLHDQEKAAR